MYMQTIHLIISNGCQGTILYYNYSDKSSDSCTLAHTRIAIERCKKQIK